MGQTYSGERRPSWMDDYEQDQEEIVSDPLFHEVTRPTQEANHGAIFSRSVTALEGSQYDRDGTQPCQKSSKVPAVAVNTCTSFPPDAGSLDSRPCTPYPQEHPKTSVSPSPGPHHAPSETASEPSPSLSTSDNLPTTDKTSDTEQSPLLRDTPP